MLSSIVLPPFQQVHEGKVARNEIRANLTELEPPAVVQIIRSARTSEGVVHHEEGRHQAVGALLRIAEVIDLRGAKIDSITRLDPDLFTNLTLGSSFERGVRGANEATDKAPLPVVGLLLTEQYVTMLHHAHVHT